MEPEEEKPEEKEKTKQKVEQEKLLKPKEIFDPGGKKHENWVSMAMMDDPEDTEPAEWVKEERLQK